MIHFLNRLSWEKRKMTPKQVKNQKFKIQKKSLKWKEVNQNIKIYKIEVQICLKVKMKVTILKVVREARVVRNLIVKTLTNQARVVLMEI